MNRTLLLFLSMMTPFFILTFNGSVIHQKNAPVKIVIGSTNTCKIAAFKEVMPLYDFLASAELESRAVSSNISEQPVSLEETMQGAQNRAQAAAAYGDIGVGLESGIFNVPNTNRYMEFCACCIYANGRCAFGFSPAFEVPQEVVYYIFSHNIDLTQAMNLAGLTNNGQLGAAEGAVGVLTGGRITRKDYTKHAIIMALVQLEHMNFFI